MDHKRALPLGEELCVIGKILDDEERSGTGDNGEEAFEDEDPGPACSACLELRFCVF
jgi:hypothetical protein